ncbi:MAG: sulfotransferase [Alphaproteobacteria bacterium]|nr:sulfotransferase [Alphaproteobacteria bacterium]
MTQDPRIHVRRALAAFEARDRDLAAEHLRQLAHSKPDLGPTWGPVARMSKSIGEVSTALTAYRMFIEVDPDDRERHLELGDTLAATGRMAEAIDLANSLTQRWPAHPATHHFLGNTLAQLGETAEALESLRTAIRLYPIASDSWLTLSSLKRFSVDDPDLAHLQSVIPKAAREGNLARGTLLYALGKALDDAGDEDRAFKTYEEGARLIGLERPFSHADNDALLAETAARFDRNFLKSLSQSSVSSDRPIFVVGLPRSGTTLVEQIFAAHSAVSDGAEAGVFRHAAMALLNFRPSSLTALDRDPRWGGDAWSRIGHSYLHLLNERFGKEGRLVDKTLTHAKWIGPIAHILPNARFIWMRRNPGAVAWSCFKTRFATGIEWSWSLEAMGRHFRFMDRMHAHWSTEFPDRLLTVDYENLVAEPDVWIPRILAHAGLSDEPQTRNFHEVKRSVRTASSSQVRQPLYNRSVDGWREYERRLAPFFDAYN